VGEGDGLISTHIFLPFQHSGLFGVRAWGVGLFGVSRQLLSFFLPHTPTANGHCYHTVADLQWTGRSIRDFVGLFPTSSWCFCWVCVYNILFELLLILVRFHFIPASVGACLCHRFLPITRSLGSKISNVHIVCVISYVTTKLQCLRNALHFGYTFSQLSPLDVLICACVPAGICRRQGGL
jgi:hypothetical protein